MIVVAKSKATEFLLGQGHNQTDFRRLVTRLQASLQNEKTSELIHELFEQACLMFVNRPVQVADACLGPALIATCELEQWSLSTRLASATKIAFPKETFARLGFLYQQKSEMPPKL